MRQRIASSDGWAVVTALMVMALIISLSLATFAYVDGQTRSSNSERKRESTFNYAAGVLDAGAFQLVQAWPGSSTSPAPDCTYANGTLTSSTGSTTYCPSPTQLSQEFNNIDASGVSWTSKVRDNSGTGACQSGVFAGQAMCSYYFDESAGALSAPSYDANGDGQVWVRARTIERGVARTVVELVSAQRTPLSFPRAVVTAGTYTISGGPKSKTFANGASLLVRCPSAQTGNPQGCITEKRSDQIQPPTAVQSTDNSPALSTGALQQLRTRAKAENAWYQNCPSTTAPGPLVFIETGPCGWSALPLNTSPSNPATVVIVSGGLNLTGQSSAYRDFYGVIYLVNSGGSTDPNFFSVNGLHNFHGSINVDGAAGVNFGTSSNSSLSYDSGAFSGLWAYGNASVVRPSFREIVSSTP
jgi:Tfp pilus assembly protein PilX